MSAEGPCPSLVVGITAPASGLEALRQLLAALPTGHRMSFLLAPTLAPQRDPSLVHLLEEWTTMAVVEAEAGAAVCGDTLYVVRPDTEVAVNTAGHIEITTPPREGSHVSVDHLFRSLAKTYGSRSVGVVLSGASDDGSGGLREIKAAGGLTIAQRPDHGGESSRQGAVDAGVIELMLDVAQMPQALERFASLPARTLMESGDALDEHPERLSHLSKDDLKSLSRVLRAQIDFDLDVYKAGTIERRVARRMALSGFNDFTAYVTHLQEHPSEQQTLVRDLLISVTDFFRDLPAFETLRELVIMPLVSEAPEGTALRVWVPGCATGEEAYSIAMEFLDVIQATGKRLSLHVFATDVDHEALAVARAGIYPASTLGHLSASRLDTYFMDVKSRGYRAVSPLRDVVSFAVHDLTKDPPFSRMHLVSCRNVLIYLRPEAQSHVLKLLHFSLLPTGTLFLGTSESTGRDRELFTTVSKKWRIYKKFGVSHPVAMGRALGRAMRESEGVTAGARATHEHARNRRDGDHDLARRIIMAARVPPTIVVSEHGSVVFMHGELRPYLRFPEGDNPRFELSALVTPELTTRTRAAMYKCRRDGESVVAFSSHQSTQPGRVKITASPAPELGDGTVILTFEEVSEVSHVPSGSPDSHAQEAVITHLERELQATQEDLRNTVEELETSNEELRSSNEESVSMNEELQAANEELEATTEELRSLNEELTTVNVQLREKVEQLEQAHDDLTNFFSSTKIATIFLDHRLCIKRFTPAASELLGIDRSDAGRFIGDFARELFQHDLEREASSVLEHLTLRARELRTQDGRWITRQVLPYRTESRRIEGVVVTFVDVTEHKLATERLAVRERQQAVIARLGLHALKESELQTFFEQTVREVQQTLNTDCCKLLELQPGGGRFLLRAGVGWRDGLVGSASIDAGLDSQAGFALQSGEPVIVDDLASEKRFRNAPLLSAHHVVSGLSCVIRDGENEYGVISAHTTHRRAFTREDANFLQGVASVIGSAIGRHQTRLRMALERGVARVLADTRAGDTMVAVLGCLARELSASLVEQWWVTPGAEPLICRAAVTLPVGGTPAELLVATGAEAAATTAGFAQRVSEARAAGWITDLSEPRYFGELHDRRGLGLVSGLGFPIVAGDDLLGVIVAYSHHRLIADDVLFRSLEGLGRSMGDTLARQEVEEKARRLAAIPESSHDAILSYDFDGRIVEWLGGAEELYGYSAEEMIGQPLDQLVPPEQRAELYAVAERIRRGEMTEPLETVRRCKDGTLLEVSVRSSPIRDRAGRVIGVSSTDRDVTRQKETERMLVAADQQKDEFLAMLGHELRNPLAAMRSATELLKLTFGDDARLRRTHEILERQSTHMAKLLDGLLDISRVIRGKITLDSEIVDFAAVCREVMADLLDRIAQRDLRIESVVTEDAIMVKGDRVRLAQIVDNLLSNSVKYTSDGGVITVELAGQDGSATLMVKDTGVGIEPELLPHIFDVFRQAKQGLDRSYGGLGLGLALVKSLVDLHGGSVEAMSAGPNRGARFVVRLPLVEEVVHPLAPAGNKSTDDGCHVLLIEDNEDSAEMLRTVLELCGHRVRVANRGAVGIDMAHAEVPDVVLCDIGLPDGVTGFDVAQRLRREPATREVGLVALTGYGRPEDKVRCLRAGFDAHVTKPVDVSTVQRVLRQLTRRRRREVVHLHD